MSHRLIIIGRTGAGKSHFCKELGIVTESRMSSRRVTVEWREWQVMIDGTQYTIADTPGMYDRDDKVTKENLREVNAAFCNSKLTSVVYMFNAGYAARFERDDAEGITAVLDALGKDVSACSILFNMHAISADKRSEVYQDLAVSVSEFDERLRDCVMRQYSGDTVGTRAKDIVKLVSETNRTSLQVSGKLELLGFDARQKMAVKLQQIQEELERHKAEMERQKREAKEELERSNAKMNRRLKEAQEGSNAKMNRRLKEAQEGNAAQNVLDRLKLIRDNMDEVQTERNWEDGKQIVGAVFAPVTLGLSLALTGLGARQAYKKNRKLVSEIDKAQGIYNESPSEEAYTILCEINSMRPHGLLTF